MEKMDVDDDAVVDLSVKRDRDLVKTSTEAPQDLSRVHRLPGVENMILGETRSLIQRSIKDFDDRYPRRSLRPRTERSYAESPDIIVLSDEEPRINGYTNGYDSDTDDGEMPPLPPIKELTPAELEERERTLRKLREELRNEEMKLVLLKKLRQSQQMKENIAVGPPSQQPVVTKPSTTGKLPPPPQQQQPPPPLVRANHSKQSTPNAIPPLLRGQPPPSRPPNIHHPPPLMMAPSVRNSTTGLAPNMMMTQPTISRGGSNTLTVRPPVNTPPNVVMGYPVGSGDRTTKESHHSPAPSIIPQQQIPPPKPPPPEMHFIPNPSNTEFIYLLGLEHVVDFITKDNKTPPPPDAFKCSQCHTDFTPVWKWEKNPTKGKEPKVICEQCVTTNVKKALKAEHTNRLKTAFVKALQQEQEIEQRLAQVSSSASPQPSEPIHAPPAPSPVVMSAPTPKPATPTMPPAARHAPTPPAPPPPPAPTPPLPHREHPLAKMAAETKFNSHHAAAALHQQLLRGLPPHQPLPAHMLPFSPLLYPYQLAMAQAASGKGPVAAAAANLVELQRQAADLQRQYLLDMIPPPAPSPSRSHPHSLNNWKT
ncbi:transcriptional repressor p66-beta isoform X2 [Anabrus simplex]|uniref:transcriptional repressor p66-beta isoform X2 n=1 Tax=Anabrus simplex TaxID=316456 RepID=UPI0034DD532F